MSHEIRWLINGYSRVIWHLTSLVKLNSHSGPTAPCGCFASLAMLNSISHSYSHRLTSHNYNVQWFPLSSILISYLESIVPIYASQRSSILLRLGEEVTTAALPRPVNLRHLWHWTSRWNRLHLPHAYPYPYVLFTGELVGGTLNRAAVRETRHGNHATQMCTLAHWATTYIQQTVHVTLRHRYPQHSRPKTRPQQMWRTVTAIYTRLSRDMVAAILQAAQQLWRTVTANIFSLTHS